MAAVVIDGMAMLSLLRDEPGADSVRVLLERATERGSSLHMSVLDFALMRESVQQREGSRAWDEVAQNILSAPIEYHEIDQSLALAAIEIHSRTKIGIPESITAALAKKIKADLVTSNPTFAQLAGEVRTKFTNKD
jgi:predicted nucleic acid-binding protein